MRVEKVLTSNVSSAKLLLKIRSYEETIDPNVFVRLNEDFAIADVARLYKSATGILVRITEEAFEFWSEYYEKIEENEKTEPIPYGFTDQSLVHP